MLKLDRLDHLRAQLIQEGYDRISAPRTHVKFTGEKDPDDLLNDIDGHPHAFVIACIMDRQIRAEKAWRIPYELKLRLGFFDFANLTILGESSPGKLEEAMLQPTTLHRFPNEMSKNIIYAVRHIRNEYSSNAAAIWTGKPSSSTIVRRFLELRGVGQKIASMAANILVRDFRIDVSDRYSIDISVDVHITRVFTRMGFVPKNASVDYLIFRARELHPEYPGIFDLVLWELGREVCRPLQPACPRCRFSGHCAYNHEGEAV
jgi:endonuclease-3